MMTRIKTNSKLSARGGSSFGGKAQNYNLKVKSNVIASADASARSNPKDKL
jgi:hypothetical protein